MLTAVRPTSPSGLATMRRVAVAVLVATGALVLVLAWAAAQTEAGRTGHLAVGTTLVLCGLVIAAARRNPPRAVQVAALAAIALVGLLVWLAEPSGLQPWLVLGPVVLLAGFFTAPVVLTGLALAAITMATGALLNPTGGLVTVGSAVLLAGVLAAGTARLARVPEPVAEPEQPVLEPLAEPELRARLEVQAEVALAHGNPLALALIAPAHGRSAERLRAELAAASRGDDQLAVLDDALGVVLPAACGEVCGYALRIARTLTATVGSPVAVGVTLVEDEPYPALAMLRRAREALVAAQDAADVEGGPTAVLADTHLRRIDDAMVTQT